MGFWKGMLGYGLKRAMDDASRKAAQDAAKQKRVQAMKEYGVLKTVEVDVGDSVQWLHPQGFYVPAIIVGIKKQKVKIRVMHNGKQEEIWVGADRLGVPEGTKK